MTGSTRKSDSVLVVASFLYYLDFFSFQVLAFVVVLLLIIDIIVSLVKYRRLKRRQAEQ